MPRIRTIKPEFWDSPSTARASSWARLLFIAMWNWADDFGRGTANLKELEGFAFPNDDTFTDRSGNTVNFRELAAEVSECFGVVFYEVDGRPYYAIPTWDGHQRNEKRAKQSKYPAPPASPQVRQHVADIHGISATQERNSAEPPRSSGPGTGEQGNRGTGEVHMFNDADAPVERSRYPEEFERFWNAYPRRQKKADALKAFKSAKKRAPLDEIVSGAERLRDDPNRVDQFTPLAASWLNADGWLDDPLPERSSGGWAQRESDQNLEMLRELGQTQWALPGGDYGAE